MLFMGMIVRAVSATAASLVMLTAFAGQALAEGPKNWQMGFRPPVSPAMDQIHWFNDVILLPIVVAIVVFVLGLLVFVMWRFSEKRNPAPSKTAHNTVIEVIWTVVPVIILVVIAIPSFKLLYFVDRVEEADMTLKAIGRQWYWSYEYPDNGNFSIDAFLVDEDELEPGQKRLLTTDNAVVLPVDTTVRLLVTSSDVLHSFALPSMGIKLDAVPGQVNETWLRIDKEGTYYGQCSELCGSGHAYMPIMVEAVPKAEFERWAEQAREEFASAEGAGPATRVAEAEQGGPPAAE